MKKYYSTHPEDFKKYTTEELRDKYHISNLFAKDEVVLNYSFDDRIIVGSVMPVTKELIINEVQELNSAYFLERRELGVINIGGKGAIELDGEKFIMNELDGFYISKGVKEIKFFSDDSAKPAKFYLNSSPSHKEHPNKHIKFTEANPVAMGDAALANKRTIYQYVHPAVCESSQLCMGLTMLEEGNVWNTMPPHTHDRRMEVYLYFNIYQENCVFHLMGQKDQVRQVVMHNDEAIISPSWSIHSGAGVGNYTFIWGMCGENQTFDDMDHIKVSELK